jgi:hypothetical protein
MDVINLDYMKGEMLDSIVECVRNILELDKSMNGLNKIFFEENKPEKNGLSYKEG